MVDPNIYDDQKYTSFNYDDTISSQDCIAPTAPRASMSLALTLLFAVATTDIPASAPPAPTGSVVDIVHGRPIADPYRWLEQLGDPVVESWARAQSDYTRAVLGPAASGSTVGALPPLPPEITIEASQYRRLPSGKAVFLARIAEDPIDAIYKRIQKKQVDIKFICLASPAAEDLHTRDKPGRVSKILSLKSSGYPQEMMIFGDTMFVVSAEHSAIFGYLVENRNIVEMHRQLFTQLWKSL